MSNRLFKNWWLLLIAGILFVILGLSYFIAPGAALLTTGMFIGIMILVSGITTVSYAITLSGNEGWGWRLVEGILDILLGIIILWNPFASAMLIPIAIGVWAIVRGVILFVDSFSFKKAGVHDWWGFLLLGIISVCFGFLMLRYLGVTAFATGWMIGVILLSLGIAAIYYSFKIRKVKAKI